VSDLVTLGETTALFSSPIVGRLRDTRHLDVSIAGTESNVSIGFCRLGRTSSWIGRVGNDEFGQLILKTLRGEGVDVKGAIMDESRQTALMIKERSAENVVRVSYYRRGYAGSALTCDDLDPAIIEAAKILHVTGITMALSDSAREAVHCAVQIARKAGIVVSLDFNYRSRLWSPEDAASVVRPLALLADVIFIGEDELFILGDDPVADPVALSEEGRREVVITRGSRGATAITSSGTVDEAAVSVHAVDPVGAGDAFVAGYLVALLDGVDPHQRLKMGCVSGAFAASRMGDWECLPHRDDLELLLHESGTTLR
jgi:2-dehydro-3-deoxygluconokinase